MTHTETITDTNEALAKVLPIEQYLKRPLTHLRELAEVNSDGLDTALAVSGLMGRRGNLTAEQNAVARLLATQSQDCGSCLQIDIDLALREDVPQSLIKAVIEHRPQELGDENLRAIYDFVEAALLMQSVEDHIEKLTQSLGAAAVTDIALGVALSHFFPILKRLMGHAESCSATQLTFNEVQA
ncbi:hypothetical protein [Acanthopleuribacter pedis]|uniref:Uncharacterized protein n=1 Tax=Acanthopleuribacter pedis TaxID=442870 RepID=A0A8J7U576_9BACT|nr:hypothetical protein [Acanthopleuribacter pedis]MBO1320549.1 hypothetical protein [Acanthopleuribacter pedis]